MDIHNADFTEKGDCTLLEMFVGILFVWLMICGAQFAVGLFSDYKPTPVLRIEVLFPGYRLGCWFAQPWR